MVIRTKATLEDVINRGGSVKSVDEDSESRFTLRLSGKLIEAIDQERKKRPGNVSRNQWIVEAITENLTSE